MAVKPAAEIRIDERLVRELVEAQAAHIVARDLAITHVDEGWDCSVWRIGEDHAARLPRRAAAAALTVNEHRFLHPIGERLAAAGLGSPVPLVHGRPDAGYPWSWSLVRWFEGEPGIGVSRAKRMGWALPLAAGVAAIHIPAARGYPRNPVRGVPLTDRARVIGERFASARAAGRESPHTLDALERAWHAGLAAPPWGREPVWLHGDLHPGNVIAREDELVALIDFGDLTAGDPASDLATAWLTFDGAGRSAFRGALEGHYDPATWTRARAWAAALCVLLLQHSDDDPLYARLAADGATEIEVDTGDS
jgi:aminoglycoside phosphotransferase (APT) family kinase protein